jgi:hypothetical protein
MDNYYIGCYWKDRREDVDVCADRIVRCLEGLARCDRDFAKVFAVPRSTRKLPQHIAVNPEILKAILEQGRNREDVPPRKVIEKLGYSISLMSDHKKPREEQWVIRTMCGAYPETPGMLNYCKLSLPKRGDVANALLRRPATVCLIEVMIEAWDPDWALVQGAAFYDYVRQWSGVPKHSPQWVFVGWMAYFAARVGKPPEDLPIHARIELKRGTLIVLSEEPITIDRPDHIAIAQEVISSLKQARLIPAQ